MSDGSTNWGSAIMLILQGDNCKQMPTIMVIYRCYKNHIFSNNFAGTKEEHLNMLEGGIIAKLLDEKWTTYAKVA